MTSRAALVSLLVSSLLASPAVAQDDEEEFVDPTLRGFYLATSIGAGFDNFKGAAGAVPFDSSVAWDATVGFRFNRFISLELEYDRKDTFDDEVAGSDRVDIWTTGLNFRVHVPMGRIEPYLTYGAGVLNAESSGSGAVVAPFDRTDAMFMVGGGVQYHLTNALSIYSDAGYVRPIGNARDYGNAEVGIGVMYKFISSDY